MQPPLQTLNPGAQDPLQAVLKERHLSTHNHVPAGQLGTHEPLQLTVPPIGATHFWQPVPHASTSVLALHWLLHG
jgi:hypothetical protein